MDTKYDSYSGCHQPWGLIEYSHYFTYHTIFFRPKLRIEHEAHKENATFFPERTYRLAWTSFSRSHRYARIRVRNTGRRMLHNCQAGLRVLIPTTADTNRYPSDDSKLLTWGRSPERTDLTETRNIQGHNSELLFVVFSDSVFPTERVAAPTRYASVAIQNRLAHSELDITHSFTDGEFIVEIIITSDEGPYAKTRFRISVDRNWRNLTMTKITRAERILSPPKRFITLLRERFT